MMMDKGTRLTIFVFVHLSLHLGTVYLIRKLPIAVIIEDFLLFYFIFSLIQEWFRKKAEDYEQFIDRTHYDAQLALLSEELR